MVARLEDQSAHRVRDAERALLGAILHDDVKAFAGAAGVVDAPQLFMGADHRLIFTAMLKVRERGFAVDAITVIDELAGQLEAAGGSDYIADLYADSTGAANAASYARLIREAADKRKIVDFASRLQSAGANGAEAGALGDSAAEEFERLRKEIGGRQKPVRLPMRWSELETSTPPERTWLVSHWLTSGATLLAGQGGVGKTLLAQTIGTAIALGSNFIDEVTEPAKVLMWACEDDHDELWRRQLAICAHFGIGMAELEGRLIVEPRLGRENPLFDLVYGAPNWTSLRAELAEQIGDYGARVLFLDNIGQVYGGKENDRHHVTSFLNGLVGLAPKLNVVIMGHPSKTADSEFSGSTAWENAVRMRWYMGYQLPDQPLEEGAEADPNVRYLAKRKANYSAKDFRKLSFRNGLFVPEAADTQHLGFKEYQQAAEECVVNGLRKMLVSGIRTTDGKTSPDYLPKKMREMKLSHDFTSKELSVALSQLRLSGRIIEGPIGHYANRMPKMGLVLS